MKLYYTQTEPFSAENLRKLNARGFNGIHLPFRRIAPVAVDIDPADFVLIVVSSKHAARWLRGFPAQSVPAVAAVGRATAAELDGYRLVFDPDEAPTNAAELVSRLRERSVDPARCLFARGEKALRTVPDGLPGIAEAVVYRGQTVDTPPARPEDNAVLYFQSPSAVDDYLTHFDTTPHYLAVIGPSTAAAVRARGLVVDYQPSRPETATFLRELPAPRYFTDQTGGQPTPAKETS